METSYRVFCSYLQMQNKEVTDLLATDTRAKLEVREGQAGPFVEGLSEEQVWNGTMLKLAFSVHPLLVSCGICLHSSHGPHARSGEHSLLFQAPSMWHTGTDAQCTASPQRG